MFLLLQTIPTDIPESLEGLVVVIFSTIAAIVSVVLEKRKQRKRIKELPAEVHIRTDKFLEKAFEELQKTTELLREENRQLMSYNSSLGRVIDEYRSKYHEQVDATSTLIEDINKHKKTIEELNNKIDDLIKLIYDTIHNGHCEDLD